MRKPEYSPRALRLLASLLLLPCLSCGAFDVGAGLYPLPAIHYVFPPPSHVGLAYEDVQLTAADGQTIYGWFIPADEPRATVLMHHGAVTNRGGGVAQYLLLHDLGCNVFAYDYRGFGENGSLATLAAILPDANTALAYVQEREELDGLPIIIFGASLGTTPTLAQGAQNPNGVAAVIVEGTCIPQILPPMVFVLMGMTPSPESYLQFPNELNTVVNAPLVNLPKLFIHSAEDTTTPIAGAQTLYDMAPEPKEFAQVSGEHLMAIMADPDTYRQAISTFLDTVLGTE
jgi:fermentation-respiration switch protein FrsA (DUF1100 family)